MKFTANAFIFLIFTVSAALTLRASADLSEMSEYLFMDELITYDGVSAIFQARTIGEIMLNLLIGSDHRYGRILWNTMALTSALPAAIWKDQGQIIAGRLTMYAFIAASVFLIIFAILKNNVLRMTAAAALFSLPFTAYYSTMPKPEPMQIFFLIAFFYFYIRNAAGPGWYWIFAGLALGAKISALPLVLFFLAVYLIYNFNKNIIVIRDLVSIIAWITAGFVLAIPALLPSMSPLLALPLLFRYRLRSRQGLMSIGLFILTLHVSRKSQDYFRVYLDSTIYSTGHGADSDSVNFLTWAQYFMTQWLSDSFLLSLALLMSAALVSAAAVYLYLHRKEKTMFYPLIITASGFILDLLIMLKVKRIWGFYLYPGTFLVTAGLLYASERITEIKNKYYNYLVYFFIIILNITVAMFWIPGTVKELNNLAERTKSAGFQVKLSAYRDFLKILDEEAAKSDHLPLKISYSPDYFLPKKGPKAEFIRFWGQKGIWTGEYDLVVLSQRDMPDYVMPANAGDSAKNDFSNHIALLKTYATDYNPECIIKEAFCYSKIADLADGGAIFKKIK